MWTTLCIFRFDMACQQPVDYPSSNPNVYAYIIYKMYMLILYIIRAKLIKDKDSTSLIIKINRQSARTCLYQ